MSEWTVHTTRVARKLEWFGMTIVKRYLTDLGSDNQLDDVHLDPQYFARGIDLVLHKPEGSVVTIDLKTDSYYGSDPHHKIRGLCNPDSGLILLETVSQLQYDRKKQAEPDGTIPVRHRHDVSGWFFTLQAEEVYYYFIAILSSDQELNPIYSEYRKLAQANESTVNLEDLLIQSVKIDRDLLVSFNLKQAREWYESASDSDFEGFVGAANPSYVTVSRRAKRDNFITRGPGRSHGGIFEQVRAGLRRV